MARQKPHNPFRGFLDVMSETNRMQHQWMHRGEQEIAGHGRTHATAWVPTADIYAKGADLVIRCELAGLKRDQVDVTVSSGVMTISGDRPTGLGESEQVTYYTRERIYGAFRRSMMLPENVDKGDVIASFDNGLLEILIKGAAASKVQNVSIGGSQD